VVRPLGRSGSSATAEEETEIVEATAAAMARRYLQGPGRLGEQEGKVARRRRQYGKGKHGGAKWSEGVPQVFSDPPDSERSGILAPVFAGSSALTDRKPIVRRIREGRRMPRARTDEKRPAAEPRVAGRLGAQSARPRCCGGGMSRRAVPPPRSRVQGL